jgi:hypothetical protein
MEPRRTREDRASQVFPDRHTLSDAAGSGRDGRLVMVLILLWLLGVPLSLILILFLLGVAR